MSKYLKHL